MYGGNSIDSIRSVSTEPLFPECGEHPRGKLVLRILGTPSTCVDRGKDGISSSA
jgi:hypothetical protein